MAEKAPSVEDLAINAVGNSIQYISEDELRVRRKIDRLVLPLMCIVNFFQYLDKQSIGYAMVFDLADDLNMTNHQYSWSVSSFYFDQFAAEYIFVYIMSRLPISRFVGITVVTWGIVAGCLAAPNNFAGFTAVRFLLGFIEGGVSPAFVIVTGTWYRKSEQPFRVAGWVTCNGLAQILGAVMVYGVGLSKETAIASGRVMFLVYGGGTVLAGVLFLFLMPLDPSSSWFPNETERQIAVRRLADDRISKEGTTFTKSQLLECVLDLRVWLLVLAAFLNTLASPVIKFGTLVINGFGYSKLETMLVSLPAGAIKIIVIWVVVIEIRVTPIPRSYWGIIATIPPFVGNVGLATLPQSSSWGIVVCTWLATVLSPNMVVVLSLIASNFKGSTKTSAVSNGYFILYAIAAIVGPQLWTEPPRYTAGIVADLVSLGGIMAVFVLFCFSAKWENGRCDRLQDDNYLEAGDADVPDKHDMSFRYTP